MAAKLAIAIVSASRLVSDSALRRQVHYPMDWPARTQARLPVGEAAIRPCHLIQREPRADSFEACSCMISSNTPSNPWGGTVGVAPICVATHDANPFARSLIV